MNENRMGATLKIVGLVLISILVVSCAKGKVDEGVPKAIVNHFANNFKVDPAKVTVRAKGDVKNIVTFEASTQGSPNVKYTMAKKQLEQMVHSSEALPCFHCVEYCGQGTGGSAGGGAVCCKYEACK